MICCYDNQTFDRIKDEQKEIWKEIINFLNDFQLSSIDPDLYLTLKAGEVTNFIWNMELRDGTH